MPDRATPPPDAADLPTASVPVDAAAGSGWPDVLAHLAGALGIGAMSGFLVLWTTPGVRLGIPVGGLDIIDLAPPLVALGVLGLASVARLRPYAWLIAAAGLLGFAGLYAQGGRLDGYSLVIALMAVTTLQFGGLLLALAQASERARMAVTVGLGAGIVAGRDVLAWLVGAVRPIRGSGLGDDVVYAGMGVLVAAAGVALLLRPRAIPSPARPIGWWPLAGVAGASVLTVGLTQAWNGAFADLTSRYVGGISAADGRILQTWDELARVGLAVLVAALLVLVAYRWNGPGTARWVATGIGAALLLAVLQELVAYRVTPLVVGLAAAGALAGTVLARRAVPRVPWDAVGLALGSCLAFSASSSWLWPVGWFGFAFAVSAGLTELARSGGDRVAPAAGLGLAALLLGYQAVAPASIAGARVDGGPIVVAGGVTLVVVAVAVFFVLDRRREARSGSEQS